MQKAGPRIQAMECQILTVPPSVKYGKENIWSINAIVIVPLKTSKKVMVNPIFAPYVIIALNPPGFPILYSRRSFPVARFPIQTENGRAPIKYAPRHANTIQRMIK